MLTKLRSILKQNKGVAMTEIIVAFLVLMICLAMLYTCMKLSSNLILKAKDTDDSHAEYQKSAQESLVANSYPETGSGSVTYSFRNGYTLKLNTATVTATDGEDNSRDIPVFATKAD